MHEIETMAYTNEEPWHGLGERVDDTLTPEAMIKAAHLDWRVEKRAIFYSLPGNPVPTRQVEDKFALVRTSDSKCLSVVGRRYVPTQNIQAFTFFKEFVEAGDAKMETAGSLLGGRRVWGLANLQESFKLADDDEVKGYLLVVSPHEHGKSLVIRFTPIRVVCHNTLTLAIHSPGNEFRMTHHNKFTSFAAKRAKIVLGIAREKMDEFHENAKQLKKMTLNEDDVRRFLAPLFQHQTNVDDLIRDFSELANPKMLRIMDIYKKARGADPGTGWGVLNAVTYWTDHVASKTADRRLANAWLSKTASTKQEVLDKLLAS